MTIAIIHLKESLKRAEANLGHSQHEMDVYLKSAMEALNTRALKAREVTELKQAIATLQDAQPQNACSEGRIMGQTSAPSC